MAEHRSSAAASEERRHERHEQQERTQREQRRAHEATARAVQQADVLAWLDAETKNHVGSIDGSCCRALVHRALAHFGVTTAPEEP
jgi:hypothetical protein